MNELVKVHIADFGLVQDSVCDARELHRVLGVGRDFTTWFRSRVRSGGFVEWVDYLVTAVSMGNSSKNNIFPKTGENCLEAVGRPPMEYVVTTHMAQHLALMEKTNIGRRVRDYFIRMEAAAVRQVQFLQSAPPGVSYVFAREVAEMKSYSAKLENVVAVHTEKINELLSEIARLQVNLERSQRQVRNATMQISELAEKIAWFDGLLPTLPPLSADDVVNLTYQDEEVAGLLQ